MDDLTSVGAFSELAHLALRLVLLAAVVCLLFLLAAGGVR